MVTATDMNAMLLEMVEEIKLLSRIVPVAESFEFAGSASGPTTYADPTGDVATSSSRLRLRSSVEHANAGVAEALQRLRTARRNLEISLENVR